MEKSKLGSKAWSLKASGISNGEQFPNASGRHKHKLSIHLGGDLFHKLRGKVMAVGNGKT